MPRQRVYKMEEFLNPSKILDQLGLQKDMTAADFGSGSGGWVLPLARKLAEGIVYAIDVLEEPLSALKSKAQIQKISNIKTLIADVEKRVPLADESCDLVLMTNLLFELDDKKGALAEGKRVLKNGGIILLVDWKEDASLGPREGRFPAGEVKAMAQELGLKIEKEFDAGVYHYGLIMVK